ncbi:MAG: T9SS type A sorting domain-containing protein [Calditrichaeota bacterium]|nr:T9SS type A sorting domain-containing protein [Calditrichota bacterium]
MMKYLFTLIFVVLLTTIQLNAQDSLGIRQVGSMFNYWDEAYAVAISGEIVYVATDHTGLNVMTISEENHLSQAGHLRGISPHSIIFENDQAYLLAQQNLTITNLDENPVIIGSIDLDYGMYFDVEDDLAVISCLRVGLIIVDVSEPEQPEIISATDMPEDPLGVAVCGSTIFASYDDEGVYIINIENLNEPEIILQIEEYGDVNHIVIKENLAVFSTEESGVIFLDVSNIQEPDEISSFQRGRSYKKTQIRDNLAYSQYDWGYLSVYDIEDIANPELLSNGVGNRHSSDFEIEDDKLIMNVCEDFPRNSQTAVGVYLYDLEDPIRPNQTDRFLSMGYASGVLVRDDILFLLEGNLWSEFEDEEDELHFAELNLISVANPENPIYLAGYAPNSGDIADVDMIGDYVYFATGSGGMEVLDINDPQRPRRIGRVNFPCFIVAADDTHAYLSSSQLDRRWRTRMAIVDVTNPEDPVIVSDIDTEDIVFDLVIDNGFVYIANNNRGLTIIDVSDRENPEEVGNLPGRKIRSLAVQNEIAFLPVYKQEEPDSGLWIIDVSDPANPEELAFFQWECAPGGIDVQNEFAVVTSKYPHSMWILDISDPGNPEVRGSFIDYSSYGSLAIQGEYSFIANGSHLNIFDCAGAMGIPFPPDWSIEPENVIVTETDTVEFEMVAVDPNGNEIALDMDQRNLPDDIEFTDEGEGRGHFRWVTGYDDAGEYNPIFIASDGESESSIIVNIQIENLNRAPFLINPLADIVHIEDGGRLEIAMLDTIFHDPDNEELQYIIIDAPEPLALSIERNAVLSLNPEQDFNLPGGAEITLRCQDAEGAALSEAFNVRIEPVNDAPRRFGLLVPADGAVIPENEATFIWQGSSDIDSDSVGYCLNLNIDYNDLDTIFTFDTGTDTTISISEMDTISAYLGIWEQITATWYVEASDGLLLTESFNRYDIVIPFTQSVDDPQIVLPDQFSLGLNYPNPFNNSTTISFTVPSTAQIRIDIYDIYGRFEASLVDGPINAGYHHVVWNARAPAGIYFYRLTADRYSQTSKMVLVK